MCKVRYMLSLVILLALILTSCTTKKTEVVDVDTETRMTGSMDTVGSSDVEAIDDVQTDLEAAELSGFDYSKVFTEDGYIKGVKAIELIPDLFDYTSLELPSGVATVTDEAVQEQLDSICKYYDITKQVKNRVIKAGDVVNIDYVGTVNGEEFEGGNTEKQGTNVTAGSDEYIDDFLQQIIGHKPGETLDVVVTFPDDYGVPELCGKEAEFKTTLNYIVELGELTDADVSTNLSLANGWNTVKEAKEGIRANIQKNQIATYIAQYLSDYAMEHVDKTKLPKDYLEYFDEVSVAYFQDSASRAGMSYKDYLNTFMQVDTTEALLEKLREGNDKELVISIVVQAIAEKENMTISDEDILEYMNDYSNGTDVTNLDEYKELYGLSYIKHIVLEGKVKEFLYAKVSF